MAELKLISADSHVNEPGDLWVERIDQSFRERAPRIVENPPGQRPGAYLILEGMPPIHMAQGIGAGKKPEELPEFFRSSTYKDVRPGGWDQVTGSVEEVNGTVVDGCRRRHVAEPVDDERSLHLDGSGLAPRHLRCAVEQLQRPSGVSEIEHDHRERAADVAQRSLVDSGTALDAAFEIGPRPDEIVELAARRSPSPQRANLIEARRRRISEHTLREDQRVCRIRMD